MALTDEESHLISEVGVEALELSKPDKPHSWWLPSFGSISTSHGGRRRCLVTGTWYQAQPSSSPSVRRVTLDYFTYLCRTTFARALFTTVWHLSCSRTAYPNGIADLLPMKGRSVPGSCQEAFRWHRRSSSGSFYRYFLCRKSGKTPATPR